MKLPFFGLIFEKMEAIWGIKKEFRLKVLFLTLAFFMLTACQAIWRPLKTAVFISLVGAKQIPKAKMLLMLPLIFLIIIYSKLVDWLRRHQLFYWFAISHGLVGILMFFLLSDPVYGLPNTAQSSSRLLGWMYYLFMESFGAFMSAVFWSFANSINKPKDAKNYYSLLVSGSKIGGILGAGSLFTLTLIFGRSSSMFNSPTTVPYFVLAGSLLLFAAAGAIYLLMKYVPGYLMHGYESAYQLEKKREVTKKTMWQSFKDAFEGFFLIAKNPYVFGILTIIMSYEVIIVIFDYLLALAASSKHSDVLSLTNFYSLYMLLMHSVGLVIALFGTAPIQRFLGIRLSLFACPAVTLLVMLTVFFVPSPEIIFSAVVLLRALNYGLNHPTREALFIPTTKAIKFKAKAWTDAFGSRIAKTTGSFFNDFILHGLVHASTVLSMAITGVWVVIAYFLGKTFQSTVDQNKVIGAQEENE
jgi:AAA family ATP:ADP antiporter